MALTDKLTAIADAIREKTGDTEPLSLDGMVDAIESITTGGGGGDGDDLNKFLTGTLEEIDDDGLTTLANYAVYQNNGIKRIKLKNATSIGDRSLSECANLESVDLPVATSIGNYCCRMSSKLVNVNMPKVNKITQSCFQGNTSLAYIDLHVAEGFASTCFDGCTNLSTLIIRTITPTNLPPTSGSNFLRNTSIAAGSGYIYVPFEMIEKYKPSGNWQAYASQFRALEDYTVDGTITGELDMSKI